MTPDQKKLLGQTALAVLSGAAAGLLAALAVGGRKDPRVDALWDFSKVDAGRISAVEDELGRFTAETEGRLSRLARFSLEDNLALQELQKRTGGAPLWTEATRRMVDGLGPESLLAPLGAPRKKESQ
jgi:hypothetical protein